MTPTTAIPAADLIKTAATPGSGIVPFPTRNVPLFAPAGYAPPAVTPMPASDLSLSYSTWDSDPVGLPAARRTPRIGDTVLGFKLVGELGRGAFARVYLAHQESLSDRKVALKVTLRPTHEAQRLARLQHANVVPVYSVHDDAPVQVICMPYLGRTTIADLIRAYRVDQASRTSSRRKNNSTRATHRTMAVKSGSASKSASSSTGDMSPTTRPMDWTWSNGDAPPVIGDPVAVLRVLARLAAGLTHAHERGILHLDLKPANVLLADTGEPMLLDFNLSFDTNRPDRELIGGTVPYMAIEQLLDMRDRGKGVIDARTDLYALGVMAFEMLTGTVPFPSASRDLQNMDALIAARRAGPLPLRERNPLVTPAVAAIVGKLLAPEAADRYQTAEQLRTDIERHLNDQPLAFAREPRGVERVSKWRRRNPGLAVRLGAACLFGLTLALGGIAYQRADASATAEAVERVRGTHAALDTVRLDLVLPADPVARARGVKRATELLAAYGLPDNTDWQKRPDVQRLPEADRVTLADDLKELQILLALVRLHEANAVPEAERRALEAAANPPVADRLTGPRGEFLDAAFALNRGYYRAAIPLLERVIDAQPAHAAAHYCLAYCFQQMAQYQRALERYDMARVLLPGDPRPAFQRGMIYGVTKNPSGAVAEFSRALDTDPNFAEAYRYRALARYRVAMGVEKATDKAKYLADAETDLNAALERGVPPLFVHLLRAQVRSLLGNTKGAAADRAAANTIHPKTEEDYLIRGSMRRDSDPKSALSDYQKAAELNPRSYIALQNIAHLLSDKLRDNVAALVVLDRLVRFYPDFAPAIAGRAVLLARLTRYEDAQKEMEKARKLSNTTPLEGRIVSSDSALSVCMKTYTPTLDAAVLTRLCDYAALFADDFPQAKPATWAGVYIQGLLLDGERKSVEPLARRVTLPDGLTSKDP